MLRNHTFDISITRARASHITESYLLFIHSSIIFISIFHVECAQYYLLRCEKIFSSVCCCQARAIPEILPVALYIYSLLIYIMLRRAWKEKISREFPQLKPTRSLRQTFLLIPSRLAPSPHTTTIPHTRVYKVRSRHSHWFGVKFTRCYYILNKLSYFLVCECFTTFCVTSNY